MKATVRCDSCEWSLSTTDLVAWHNQACPQCGAKPVVSDDDLRAWAVLIATKADGLIDPPNADVVMTIDTGPLRRGEDVAITTKEIDRA